MRLDPRNLEARCSCIKQGCSFNLSRFRVSSRDDDSTMREKVSMVEDARETRRRGERFGVYTSKRER